MSSAHNNEDFDDSQNTSWSTSPTNSNHESLDTDSLFFFFFLRDYLRPPTGDTRIYPLQRQAVYIGC